MDAKLTQAQPGPAPSEDTRPSFGPSETSRRFPIVGIGASAGGLEALEQFRTKMPAESGMAFIVVQHLDPTHKGILPELLQRVTGMPVVQAKQRMPVEPDHFYVIPPNKDLFVSQGVLHLQAPAQPRGHRLPIDFLLVSLTQEQGRQQCKSCRMT